MIPGAFDYHRPQSLDEAVALLSTHGDEGRLLAGGHSLIPMMKLRLANPAHLIDLRAVAALKGIEEAGGAIRIGAMTTQAEIVASEALAAKLPILPETALQIADPQVRYCGTIGGNLANGDPGNDMPAVMMALGAEFLVRGPTGERTIAARDYYQGAFTTALAETEVLTAVRIVVPPAGHGSAYEKMKRKVGDYATAAAAVILVMDGNACRDARIALTNLATVPLFAEAAGQALVGTTVDAAAIEQAAAAAVAITDPAADLRGPPEFRRHVAGVMVRRALSRARERAGRA
ncbi:MAG TPA: xanthine dehydrogenase family protein subunit M [Geminicoccaceae bacterium]|nr:xanthine dehydrogenase family protein subunit M [Geminicoccaceae bacterium]